MKDKLNHLFKTYPTVNEWHTTSDEQAFAEKHHAQSHAASLEKKGKGGAVKTFKKGEAVEAIEQSAIGDEQPAIDNETAKKPEAKKPAAKKK
jgi:hypothetical protein